MSCTRALHTHTHTYTNGNTKRYHRHHTQPTPSTSNPDSKHNISSRDTFCHALAASTRFLYPYVAHTHTPMQTQGGITDTPPHPKLMTSYTSPHACSRQQANSVQQNFISKDFKRYCHLKYKTVERAVNWPVLSPLLY